MTTLAADALRKHELGEVQSYGMGAVKIYEGAAVGLVDATGYVRALNAADKFVGWAESTIDNSAGAANDKAMRCKQKGEIVLLVTGAVITDINVPVYATDDNAFSFSPVGGVFIGFFRRYISAGLGVVSYDVFNYIDPYAGWVHSLKSANYTIDATDTGKWIWVDTDAVVITLPAVEGIGFVRIGNLGAFGTVGWTVAPNAADMIEGPGITAADNKGIVNTKATAKRGDWLEINDGDANGWSARWGRSPIFARVA